MEDLIRIHDRLTADPIGTHIRSSRAHRTPQEPPLPREEDIPGDIELARNNCQVLSQTLSFTDPSKEDIAKNELIQVWINIMQFSSPIMIFFNHSELGILCEMQGSACNHHAAFTDSF